MWATYEATLSCSFRMEEKQLLLRLTMWPSVCIHGNFEGARARFCTKTRRNTRSRNTILTVVIMVVHKWCIDRAVIALVWAGFARFYAKARTSDTLVSYFDFIPSHLTLLVCWSLSVVVYSLWVYNYVYSPNRSGRKIELPPFRS